MCAQRHKQYPRNEADDLVNNLLGVDIEESKANLHDCQTCSQDLCAGWGLSNGEDGVEHGPGETHHGKLVDKLKGLSQRCVEEKGSDAEKEEGDGHEVDLGGEEATTAWAVHVS